MKPEKNIPRCRPGGKSVITAGSYLSQSRDIPSAGHISVGT